MARERSDIQNHLRTLAKEGTFYCVSYDPETGDALQIDPNESETLAPQQALCNEVSSAFEIDTRQGRDRIQRRSSWQFELLLGFSSEVSLEDFEQALMAEPPVVPEKNGHKQIRCELVSADYQHPVQQQPSTGTQARYVFEAIQKRR